MKKLLYHRQSPCVLPLCQLADTLPRRTLVIWALENAPEMIALFEKYYPEDGRVREAHTAGWAWARGTIKMPLARAAILKAHKAAGQAQAHPAAQAAARAVAHAASTVHTAGHAPGLLFYGLTAIELETGQPQQAEQKARQWQESLEHWALHAPAYPGPFAPFL